MKTEENITIVLERLTDSALENGIQGVTTQEIENVLKIKRNMVSHYLNIMVDNGSVLKTNTRPVYFSYKISLEKFKKKQTEIKKDAFNKLIGCNGSLSDIVIKCKDATMYPNKGLPILFTGSSGVGKSFMAKLTYEYAKEMEVIDQKSRFVTLNCADYANNKELLTSKLFGYVKGAFTGADHDSKGIIEEAEGGYVFLDEIHRLSPEGQEKLFLLLDEGIFEKIGESGKKRIGNVRIVCATTENVKQVLIDTFVRRIPLVINIPNISDRPIEEKIQLIQRFYREESNIFKKDMRVDKKVVNYLLCSDFGGNIGELKNAIKCSCANSYRKNFGGQIIITTSNLSENIISIEEIKPYYNFEYLDIKCGEDDFVEIKMEYFRAIENYKNIIEEIHKITKQYDSSLISSEQYKKVILLSLQQINETIELYDKQSTYNIKYKLLSDIVERELRTLESNYGIKSYEENTNLLTNILLFFYNNNKKLNSKEFINELEYISNVFKEKKYKYAYIAKVFIKNIGKDIEHDFGLNGEVYTTLFIYSLMKKEVLNEINGIILAHGTSTAHSIASIVNQLLETSVFEGFDMPMDMSIDNMIDIINSYMDNVDKKRGTIFLVDMGSLFEIYSKVKNVLEGEVAVVNNITTQLALFVGDMIVRKSSMKEIINMIVKEGKINYKYFQSKKKKKAIITTCGSGVGVAKKIKEIIESCVENEEVEVIAYDYFELKNNIKQNEIFEEYDVKLIVSTLDLKIKDTEVVLLSDFFKEEGENKLRRVFKDVIKTKDIDMFIKYLVKMFSLENIISKMIILNPEKVISDVDRILNIIERELNSKLESNIRLALFIHIAVMIERVFLDRDIYFEEDIKSEKYCITKEFQTIHKILNDELKTYSIKIPLDETVLIVRMLENKI